MYAVAHSIFRERSSPFTVNGGGARSDSVHPGVNRVESRTSSSFFVNGLLRSTAVAGANGGGPPYRGRQPVQPVGPVTVEGKFKSPADPRDGCAKPFRGRLAVPVYTLGCTPPPRRRRPSVASHSQHHIL